MGTASSKENPTSKNPAVVEPVGDEPAVVEPVGDEPAVVEPVGDEPEVVNPENWYKEEKNKKAVIDKLNEFNKDKLSVELKDGLGLKLVPVGDSVHLIIINSNDDEFHIGTAHPDGPDDTSYKNEFKEQIKKKMDKQNGGKKKTRRNQKNKKYRKNRRKTNRRKK